MPIEINLSEKYAVVTGAAGGLGRASAHRLAEAGATVAILDIDLKNARRVSSSIGNSKAFQVDLASLQSTTEALSDVESWFGRAPDIIINNAGLVSYASDAASSSIEKWDLILNVNLRGSFIVCRHFLGRMKKKGWGKIVNFSSLAAQVGGIEVDIPYTASKAGLLGLTRTLAKEVGPFGITVNAVAPGIILTDPVRRQVAGKEQGYIENIPMRRLGKPQDVADAVLFLSSPLSDYITGSVIDINGGLYMG